MFSVRENKKKRKKAQNTRKKPKTWEMPLKEKMGRKIDPPLYENPLKGFFSKFLSGRFKVLGRHFGHLGVPPPIGCPL